MASRTGDRTFYEFGAFRLDPGEQRLLRDSQPISLTPKAFDLLVYLVERDGRLIEKRTLLSALWSDAVVEEANLTYNISALRKVLDEGKEGDSMIQTVPTRGYRFVAPVRRSKPLVEPGEGASTPVNAAGPFAPRGRKRLAMMAFVSIGISVASAGVLWMPRSRGTAPEAPAEAPALTRLTANPATMSLTSAHISPDGRYLAYADAGGLQVRSIDTGETHRLRETQGMNVYGWRPDSAEVLAGQCDDNDCSGWSISLIGQERRRTGAVWQLRERVKAAPSGVRLLRLAESGTLSMDPMNGAAVHPLAAGHVIAANWSADGTRVLFVRHFSTIESVPAEGGAPVEVFHAARSQPIFDVVGASDGTVFAAMMPLDTARSTAGAEVVALWTFHTDGTGVIRGSPRRLTWTAERVSDLSASRSGARVAFQSALYQEDAYVASFDRQRGVIGTPRRLTLDDRDDVPLDWTPDSASVVLVSTRNGAAHIFKQRLDGDAPEPFITSPGSQEVARVTSDGRWVLYKERTPQGMRIMRVPLTGGTPELVYRGDGDLMCAAHGRCVLPQPEGEAEIVRALDPIGGLGGELGRIPAGSRGTFPLPNGDAFAYVVPHDKGPLNVVRVISFSGKPAEDFVVHKVIGLRNLVWLPSDSGFLISDRGNLLLVPRHGASRILWSPAPLSAEWAHASPDEKHLVISVASQQSNAWMVSGF